MSTATLPRRRTPVRRVRALIVALPSVLGVAAVALILGGAGIDNDTVVITLELTARIALVMFLVTFVARPLRDLNGAAWTRRLVVYRKWTGLSFALAMGFHVTLILTLFVINAPLPPPMIGAGDYILGGPGLLAVALLSLLSITSVQRRMGRASWRLVNLIGITWIWTVFVMCFVAGAPARGEDTGSPYLWVPLSACALAMGLRVGAAVRNHWRGRPPGLEDLAVMSGVIALYLFIGSRFA